MSMGLLDASGAACVDADGCVNFWAIDPAEPQLGTIVCGEGIQTHYMGNEGSVANTGRVRQQRRGKSAALAAQRRVGGGAAPATYNADEDTGAAGAAAYGFSVPPPRMRGDAAAASGPGGAGPGAGRAADPYARARAGRSAFKGGLSLASRSSKPSKKKHKKDKKKKHKKKHKRKRGEDGGGGGGGAGGAGAGGAIPERREGAGRVLTSGTVVTGVDGARFMSELKRGDALLVRHPTSMVTETRFVTMVLSDASLGINEPFTTDLITASPFHFVSKVRSREALAAEQAAAADKARRKKHDDARDGRFGKDYASSTHLTYRQKVGGSYKVVSRRVGGGGRQLGREELLDMRSKHKHDKYCR